VFGIYQFPSVGIFLMILRNIYKPPAALPCPQLGLYHHHLIAFLLVSHAQQAYSYIDVTETDFYQHATT